MIDLLSKSYFICTSPFQIILMKRSVMDSFNSFIDSVAGVWKRQTYKSSNIVTQRLTHVYMHAFNLYLSLLGCSCKHTQTHRHTHIQTLMHTNTHTHIKWLTLYWLTHIWYVLSVLVLFSMSHCKNAISCDTLWHHYFKSLFAPVKVCQSRRPELLRTLFNMICHCVVISIMTLPICVGAAAANFLCLGCYHISGWVTDGVKHFQCSLILSPIRLIAQSHKPPIWFM